MKHLSHIIPLLLFFIIEWFPAKGQGFYLQKLQAEDLSSITHNSDDENCIYTTNIDDASVYYYFCTEGSYYCDRTDSTAVMFSVDFEIRINDTNSRDSIFLKKIRVFSVDKTIVFMKSEIPEYDFFVNALYEILHRGCFCYYLKIPELCDTPCIKKISFFIPVLFLPKKNVHLH